MAFSKNMKQALKIFTLASIFLLFAMSYWLLATHTHAVEAKPIAQQIRISPAILNIRLAPGKTYRYEIKIDNLLSVPLPVDAAMESFMTDEEGDYTFDKNDQSFRTNEIAPWINIDENKFIIPALSSKKLTVTVSLPKTIPIGGYYGMLFFTPRIPLSGQYQSVVSSKVGVLMLASIGVAEPFIAKANILTFQPTKFIFDSEPSSFVFRVKNNSLTHFSAKAFIEIGSIFHKPNIFEAEEKIILPGNIRRWNVTVPKRMSLIPIQWATLNVSTGNGTSISKNIIILHFPIRLALISITILSMIFFVIFRRKNIIKALKILIGKG